MEGSESRDDENFPMQMPFGVGGIEVDQETQAMFKRLFARLREELPEYNVLEGFTPFHSSYDAWHVFATKRRRSSLYARKTKSKSSSTFGTNALLQLGYVVVFGALAYGRFTTRDVLA